MKRGELYWADLLPRSGSEQRGRRPVILVSDDGFNQIPTWRSLIVVPVSTLASQAGRGPTIVVIPRGSAGLDRTGVAVCHQITTLDRRKLGKRIGVLPLDIMRDVGESLKAAMDLD
jgi:mRNA interferase MazF